MKLIVIVSDFGAAANVGGCVDTEAQIFDMPPEAADFIRKSRTRWTSISLAFSDEAKAEQSMNTNIASGSEPALRHNVKENSND